MTAPRRTRANPANALLWTAQSLLALLFLYAGGMKLTVPLEMLAGPVPLPGLFLRFVGAAEVLGALGLVLPGLLRIRPRLTTLAATGLLMIMSGATVISLPLGASAWAVPLAVGVIAAGIAFGRERVPLLPFAARGSVLQAPA